MQLLCLAFDSRDHVFGHSKGYGVLRCGLGFMVRRYRHHLLAQLSERFSYAHCATFRSVRICFRQDQSARLTLISERWFSLCRSFTLASSP